MLLAVTSRAKYYKKHFWCQRINKKESNGVKVTHSWADIGFNEHNLGQKKYLAAEQAQVSEQFLFGCHGELITSQIILITSQKLKLRDC